MVAEVCNRSHSLDDTFGSRKRGKVSPMHIQESCFSLHQVMTNTKKAALAAHLPKPVVFKLLEQDATIIYLTTDRKSWVYHHATPEELSSAHSGDEDDNGDEKSPIAWSTIFKQAWEAHPKEHETIMMFGNWTKLPRFQQVCGEK
ncbi:hypothetical protein PsorP6_013213 [Peronosclerospora sorghi]|uniref:Uncharacterized protein n=1 Tax=Peronosclerospora sorghi TaxID=230839 RepID=A0ACC0WIJ6_9STRA|nr:hypothetical protein PsorP6_013213 [Peronosclerospora sorghi]